MAWISRDSRTVALLPMWVAVLVVFGLPGNGLAGKDHCRTLMLGGTAGDTSTDSVVFQLVDANGGTVINQSCQVTVKASEEAHQLGERLPIQWGNDVLAPANPTCPTDAEALALATKPNGRIKYPKKLCSDSSGGAGPSCRIKFTYKVKKSTGEVKKGPKLDICCYETPNCKGTKWGATTDNPINLQVRNNSVSLSFLPTAGALPATIGAASDLVVDPIGLDQLPVPQIQDCRQAVAGDVEKFANKVYSVLATCHSDDSVVDQSVCNSVSAASDPNGTVATAAMALRQQVRDACAELGSPAKFSYAECPAPCGGLIAGPKCVGGPSDGLNCRTDAECDSEKRCSTGNLGPACTVDGDCTVSGVCLGSGFCAGPTCTVDADCDTVPGKGKCARKGDGLCKDRCTQPPASAGNVCGVDADCDTVPGNGRCGDWAGVADCAACLTRTADENAVLALFGPSGSTIRSPAGGGRTLSAGAAQCKLYLAQTMGQLQKVELKETRSCQKLLDAGKTALPAGAEKCKDADRKGKRAKAIASIQNVLLSGKACGGGVIAELDSCGTDPASLGVCAVDAINAVNQAYGVAAVPDSRCGNGKRIGEQCDDGNTVAGDGCSAECTCEGICGDGSRNPLSVCGELCDDGNTVNGDGCDNNCTPTGCGNGIITAPEQCESDSDCPVGLPCNNCLCGTTSAVCGDGIVNGTEVCDGGASNGSGDGFCLSDCSAVQVCGDGVANGTEDCDGSDDAVCPGLCQPDCSCGLLSPTFGDLSPCDPTVLDRYQFSIGLGQTIVVTADTTDLATAADLCFGILSDCDTIDTLVGDDDIPCTFPTPGGFDCPQDVFVASGNGTCHVEVTECAFDCADVSRANYVLTVMRDGILAPLTLLNDNEPN